MSFFHGVTVTNVDVGARTIALPSSSIIGLVDTFTPDSKLTAQADMPVLLTNLREAAAAFGTASAIYKSCTAIFTSPPRWSWRWEWRKSRMPRS